MLCAFTETDEMGIEKEGERSPLLASFFGWSLFLQDSLVFVRFPAHLASSTCCHILLMRRKLEYNGWFGCYGGSAF